VPVVTGINFAPDVIALVQGVGVGFLLVGGIAIPAAAFRIFRRITGA